MKKCAKFDEDIFKRYRLTFGGVGVFYRHFWVSKAITTAHAQKVVSFFIISHRLLKAGGGGGGGTSFMLLKSAIAIGEVLQNAFRYDFRKGPRDISASAVITVLKAVMHVNTVNTVPAEISRGPFRKSYRNSFCKTSLFCVNCICLHYLCEWNTFRYKTV